MRVAAAREGYGPCQRTVVAPPISLTVVPAAIPVNLGFRGIVKVFEDDVLHHHSAHPGSTAGSRPLVTPPIRPRSGGGCRWPVTARGVPYPLRTRRESKKGLVPPAAFD